MELAQLRYFREIARLGSMTAAARALGLRQPTLSAAVRQLEEELGATLLQRHRGGASLTAAGSELLRHADEIFALLDRAAAGIAGLEHDLVGHFVLGCHESLGAYFLPRLLPVVLKDAPKIALSLRNAPSAEVLAAVLEREVHLGLVVNPHPHPDLVMVPLFADAVDFFVRAPANAPAAPSGAAIYAPRAAPPTSSPPRSRSSTPAPHLRRSRPAVRRAARAARRARRRAPTSALLRRLRAGQEPRPRRRRGRDPAAPDRRLRPRGRAASPPPAAPDRPRRDRPRLPRRPAEDPRRRLPQGRDRQHQPRHARHRPAPPPALTASPEQPPRRVATARPGAS
ncbi:MAG: LysR family transcriptional regulator [Nannocystis sp.]|nr:LysR family transcriptional regulator [Nannocystis sp.]